MVCNLTHSQIILRYKENGRWSEPYIYAFYLYNLLWHDPLDPIAFWFEKMNEMKYVWIKKKLFIILLLFWVFRFSEIVFGFLVFNLPYFISSNHVALCNCGRQFVYFSLFVEQNGKWRKRERELKRKG
jgi:hypothetical protein